MIFQKKSFTNRSLFNLNDCLDPYSETNTYKIIQNNNAGLPYIKKIPKNSFANEFRKLQQIENKLHQYKNTHKSQHLPELPVDENQILQECTIKKLVHEQNNSNTSNINNLKEKFEELKQIKFPSSINKQLKNIFNQSIDSVDYKDFQSNMQKSLGQICKSIKDDIDQENQRTNLFMNEIKKGLIEIKLGLNNKLNNNLKEGNKSVKEIGEGMQNEKETRMKYLANKLFPQSEIDEVSENENEKECKREKEERKALLKLSPMSSHLSKLSQNKDNKINNKHLNINLIPIYNNDIKENKEKVKINYLDYRLIYLKEQMKIYNEVKAYLSTYPSLNYPFRHINKFRAYVYFIIGARRLLNIQYVIYSRIKFDSVHYFIDNYEDMDIIFKKLMFNSVKPVLHEILNDKILDLNIAVKKPNSHHLFLILKDVLEGIIIEGLINQFYQGISNNMLKFLSILISNYSYVPRDFYSTFELVRFRTTRTGELIELNQESQKMILGFYLVIKILLKNLFLELLFNEKSIKSLSMKNKLNIKMIVSIIYRGIIQQFKRCPTQRNANEIEEPEDEMNYTKIIYKKKSIIVNEQFRRVKINHKPLNEDENQDEITENYFEKRKQIAQLINPLNEEYKQQKNELGNEYKRNVNNEIIFKNNTKKKRKNDKMRYNEENNEDNNELTEENHLNKVVSNIKTIGKNKSKVLNREIDNNTQKKQIESQKNAKSKKHKSKKNTPNLIKNQNNSNENRNYMNNNNTSSIQIENKKQILINNTEEKPKLVTKRKNKNEKLQNQSQQQLLPTEKKIRNKQNMMNKEFQPHIKLIPQLSNTNLDLCLNSKLNKSKSFLQSKHICENQISNSPLMQTQITEFSKDEARVMAFILNNLSDYGEDSNIHEFELIHNVVYPVQFLQRYELFREEYSFDPIQPIMSFLDKLYDMILSNFSVNN